MGSVIKLSLIFIMLSYQLIYAITKVSLIDIVRDYWDRLMRFASKKSGEQYYKNKNKFARMSEYEKLKSKSYKRYVFINEILLDLGLKSKGVTVEGFITFCIMASGIISLILTFFTQNIIFTLFIFVAVFAFIVSAAFSISKFQHGKRKEALMNAEDYICGAMSMGLVNAIEENLKLFDKSVRPIFKKFLDEVNERNVDIFTAIDNLNENCGVQFDNFCKYAKIYERERRPGMENYFQYNISNNAFVRALDRDCAKEFANMNKAYFACLGIMVGFIAFTILSYAATAEFYSSLFGKFILCVYLFIVVGQFLYIQLIQSKPFIYGQ